MLELRDWPNPDIRPRDLIVEVRAAGVNRADLSYRKGFFGRANFGDSDLMGLEIAGNVIECGNEVLGFAQGDRVKLPSHRVRACCGPLGLLDARS